MILTLWTTLALFSLVLIVIGLVKPDESAQAIIGFFFLFLLSFPLINGSLEIETGANITTTFSYDVSGNVNGSLQNVDYDYTLWKDTTSHNIGYWLAIASSVGFFGVLFNLDKVKLWWARRRGGDNEEI